MIIDFEKIHKLAVEAREEETDIYRLIKYREYTIMRKPMGKHEGSCKGFSCIVSRIPIIGINSDCSEATQRKVTGHECGHIIVPSKKRGLQAFHDFDVYGDYVNDCDEMSANIWSAEYQLSDDEVLEILNENYGFFEAARRLGVSPEMLDFKFRGMKGRGFKFDSPIYTKASFMNEV